jgi:hypothetical protein
VTLAQRKTKLSAADPDFGFFGRAMLRRCHLRRAANALYRGSPPHKKMPCKALFDLAFSCENITSNTRKGSGKPWCISVPIRDHR